MKKLDTILSLVVALIFLQTLFFKFTGAPESVWIFSKLQVEPWGRYFSGVCELIAAILIMVPGLRIFGSLMAFGIMAGAALSHLFILGIDVQGDGGLLFGLALVALILSAVISLRNLDKLPKLGRAVFIILLFPTLGHSKVSYNTESTYGIHGYDPVSYLSDSKAVEGKKEFSHSHDGVTYLFSSSKNKDLFTAAPGKYIPAYGGWCAYAMADDEKVDIDPKTFKVIGGVTYLFYNGIWGNTLEKWNKNEAGLKTKADAYWEKLIK